MNEPRAQSSAPALSGADLLLRAEALDKSFLDAGREVRVLHGLEMEVKAGEEIAVVGQSGQWRAGVAVPDAGRAVEARGGETPAVGAERH